MQKKKWKKPELIVLVRGKSSEAVLTACKGDIDSDGPSGFYEFCKSIDMACNICDNISTT